MVSFRSCLRGVHLKPLRQTQDTTGWFYFPAGLGSLGGLPGRVGEEQSAVVCLLRTLSTPLRRRGRIWDQKLQQTPESFTLYLIIYLCGRNCYSLGVHVHWLLGTSEVGHDISVYWRPKRHHVDWDTSVHLYLGHCTTVFPGGAPDSSYTPHSVNRSLHINHQCDFFWVIKLSLIAAWQWTSELLGGVYPAFFNADLEDEILGECPPTKRKVVPWN